ncbi:hypothetical protein ACVWPW_29365, partial [Citrobacter freundii complex sp. 2025EL-00205]
GLTAKISVADRIVAADGTEYYGKDMGLPALGEGSFTVINDTLDLQQAVVSSNVSFHHRYYSAEVHQHIPKPERRL